MSSTDSSDPKSISAAAKHRANQATYYAAHREERRVAEAVYRATHREELRIRNAVYYAAHRGERRAASTAYYVAHREQSHETQAAYRLAHREEIRAASAVYRAAHGEEQRTASRAHYMAHRGEYQARAANWLAAHPGQRREFVHRRRARLRSQFAARVDIMAIYERDKGYCHICGKKVKRSAASMDHLLPISRGGVHAPWNVALSRRHCNTRRGAYGIAQMRLAIA